MGGLLLKSGVVFLPLAAVYFLFGVFLLTPYAGREGASFNFALYACGFLASLAGFCLCIRRAVRRRRTAR